MHPLHDEMAMDLSGPAAWRAGRPGQGARRLSAFLLRPRRPLWQYALLLWPLALLPSTLLLFTAVGVGTLLGWSEAQLLGAHQTPVAIDALGSVLVAPVVETLLLALGIGGLRRVTKRPLVVAAISALVWGLLHGLDAPVRFFGSFWCFFVFGCAYQAWRPRSFGHGFIAAALPHLLLNATALAVQRIAT